MENKDKNGKAKSISFNLTSNEGNSLTKAEFTSLLKASITPKNKKNKR